MKLIIAIVNNDDNHILNENLMKEGFGVTKLATSGGFLRAGNTTLLIGVEDERLDEVLAIIKENCKMRKEVVPTAVAAPFGAGVYNGFPVEVKIGGATVFILNIERMEKM